MPRLSDLLPRPDKCREREGYSARRRVLVDPERRLSLAWLPDLAEVKGATISIRALSWR